MHPAAIVFIVIGGVACVWGGYELGSKLYDWMTIRRERRAYEEYVYNYQDKQGWVYTDFSEDDSTDDDAQMANPSTLRKRKCMDEQELDDMGSSLAWRRHQLGRQASLLVEEEETYRRRKQEILEQRGNRVMGLADEPLSQLSSRSTSITPIPSTASLDPMQTPRFASHHSQQTELDSPLLHSSWPALPLSSTPSGDSSTQPQPPTPSHPPSVSSKESWTHVSPSDSLCEPRQSHSSDDDLSYTMISTSLSTSFQNQQLAP
ncbi:hypothetical protein DM01DRAFT_314325 [Hesseltinella vesiculosa]|uniref:Uncharacterized protein n=1 Tax=Hesseltinella vesiculosa TaxID=101127 RepID=A0A1X2GTU6_9FUNG|nr:hypothetical protein DM01DRAFT_314325 [Hesseltinella vesiculosa]